MLKKLSLLIKVIINSEILFKNPPKKELLIFDSTSISLIKKSILTYFNYYVYEDRGYLIKKIYISFDVIKHVLLNYNHGLKNAYAIAIIKLVNPKLILTILNESKNFLYLAKILNKEFNFLWLQIASHCYRINEKFYLRKSRGVNIHSYLVPHILLFSDYDRMNFKKIPQIQIRKSDVVGSVKLEIFKKRLSEKKFTSPQKKYDICLLSEIGAMEFETKKNDYNFIKLIKFVTRYSKEKNLKIVFALKRKKPNKNELSKLNAVFSSYHQEQNWYKKNLNESDYQFLKTKFKNQNFFSSYVAATESRLVIATMSTLLREVFSMKKKILACNFTSNKIYDFPIKGISSINFDCQYSFFKKRMDKIFNISTKEYFRLSKFKKNYDLGVNQKNQSIKKILRIIDTYTRKNLKSL
jgi:hypothetical protein